MTLPGRRMVTAYWSTASGRAASRRRAPWIDLWMKEIAPSADLQVVLPRYGKVEEFTRHYTWNFLKEEKLMEIKRLEREHQSVTAVCLEGYRTQSGTGTLAGID